MIRGWTKKCPQVKAGKPKIGPREGKPEWRAAVEGGTPGCDHAYRLHVWQIKESIDSQYDADMTRLKRAAIRGRTLSAGFGLNALDKKKPADESGLKTIFLEENSGDEAEYAAPPHICPIVKSDTRHTTHL
jgi:hypothetical protein